MNPPYKITGEFDQKCIQQCICLECYELMEWARTPDPLLGPVTWRCRCGVIYKEAEQRTLTGGRGSYILRVA